MGVDRFKGLTNNGGSRGDPGRQLRRLYNDFGIIPSADLGAKGERRRHTPQGKFEPIGQLGQSEHSKKRHHGKGKFRNQ